ncbi:hypothetical protein CAPTEDRAFT_208125 [Capitella teleta]|uniref:VWFC domain-containing protein n=1 Tax=Capitella teleta TaxID=283909 RepID=R7URI7_CAPTE|nr:hypothetical protein CAPTEDRAFT_208125 [Capitella teleta]|eukprot:ELU08820.1 hypothetical protein CAPTEDRAFT_208125 [Capitella teleta]
MLHNSLLLVLLLVGQAVSFDQTDRSEEDFHGCRYRGETYEVGERVPHHDKCANCRCRGADEGVRCAMTMCERPRCVDSVEIEGSCCRRCPNGSNCMSPHGELLAADETAITPYGSYCSIVCRCRSRHFYRRQAHCSMDCSFPGSNESDEYNGSDESKSSEESRSSESYESDEY